MPPKVSCTGPLEEKALIAALLVTSVFLQGGHWENEFEGFAAKPETARGIARAVYAGMFGEAYARAIGNLRVRKTMGRWVITPEFEVPPDTFIESYEMAIDPESGRVVGVSIRPGGIKDLIRNVAPDQFGFLKNVPFGEPLFKGRSMPSAIVEAFAAFFNAKEHSIAVRRELSKGKLVVPFLKPGTKLSIGNRRFATSAWHEAAIGAGQVSVNCFMPLKPTPFKGETQRFFISALLHRQGYQINAVVSKKNGGWTVESYAQPQAGS